MITSRRSMIRTVTGLALAFGCCWAQASESPPAPRTVASEIPAFVAPHDPPSDPAEVGETLPEPEGSLVLQDALAAALMNSPELAMFSWEERASEARSLQAGKWQNPELDFRFYRLDSSRAGKLEDERRNRVILSQVFELGRKPHKRTVLADMESDLAGWNYEAKRIDVATEVAARFVAVLGGQRRVDSLRRQVEFMEKTQGDVATMVETGAMRSLEIHRIGRQTGLARVELQRAEGELSAARFRLAAVWGSDSPKFTEAVGDLEETGILPDIGTVIEISKQSPAIGRWEAELARGQAALSLAKARRVPDLRAGVGIRWEEGANQTDYLIDLEIDLPFVDRKQGEIRAARYEMARAEAGRKAAEAASSESIAEFYYRVETARQRSIVLLRDVLPAAEASFESHRTGFNRAAVNLADILDARRDVASAEIDYIDALIDYHLSLAILEGIVGQSLTSPD